MFNKRINLQLFAADTGASDGGAGTGADTGAGAGTGADAGAGTGSQGQQDDKGQELELPKSKEELDKLIEKAVKDTSTKLQKDFDTKLATEKAEAERLAKLSAADKEKELTKKQQDALSKKEQELARKELELKTVDLLKEKSLPLDFKPFVIGADEDGTKERVESFEKLWQKAVEEAVNERLKGKSPLHVTQQPGASSGFFESVTKNQYRR